MINLHQAREASMFSQTFTADPEHDFFTGPVVPKGEAWALTSLWMRVGALGCTEAMCGVVSEDKFIALTSSRQLREGDAVSWSGNVLLSEGEGPLFLIRGAKQDTDVACSATWTVLNVTGRSRTKKAGAKSNGSSQSITEPDKTA